MFLCFGSADRDMHTDDETSESLPDAFRLGPYEIHRRLRIIRRGDRETRVEPEAMAVLTAMAEAAPSPVSREALLERVWGRQAVGDEVLARRVQQLRKAFGDHPRRPGLIETIPKQGYRLRVAPTPLDSPTGSPAEAVPSGMPPPTPLLRRITAVVLAVIVVGLGYVGFMQTLRQDEAPPADADQPPLGEPAPFTASIAVLPLRDLSPDGGGFLATGLATELVRALTAIEDLKVIASASAAFAAAETEDPIALAGRLDVSSVLDGTVQVEGDALRVVLVLLDGGTGQSLWSQAYDAGFDDLPGLQREMAADVTARIPGLLGGAEPAFAGDPAPGVYADYLRALAAFSARERGSEGYAEAEALVEDVLERAPDYAPAHALAAEMWLVAWQGRPDVTVAEAISRAEEHAEQALAANPDEARARRTLGQLAHNAGRLAEAENNYRAGIRARPGYAGLRMSYAQLLRDTGRVRAALAQLERARALDPESPYLLRDLISTYIVADELSAAQEAAETAERMGLTVNPYTDMHLQVRLREWDTLQRRIESLWRDTGRDPSWAAPAVALIAGAGDRETAMAAVEAAVASGDLDPGTEFAVYAYAGELDAAMRRLHRLMDKGPYAGWTQVWFPAMAPLRADARFGELTQRHGLIAFWHRFGWPDHCTPDGGRARCR
jgi:DNA-binding winged helix-turn-helix (wHTH) protein/TolB-like protein